LQEEVERLRGLLKEKDSELEKVDVAPPANPAPLTMWHSFLYVREGVFEISAKRLDIHCTTSYISRQMPEPQNTFRKLNLITEMEERFRE